MAFISFASLGSEGAGPQAESWLSVSASDASPTATSSKTAARAGAKRDEDAVPLGRSAREQVVLRFRLRTMPASRPELEPARELFARSCASCHGAAGEGEREED